MITALDCCNLNFLLHFRALEIIVFTSTASCVALVPICFYTTNVRSIVNNLTNELLMLYAFNAIVYYAQTFLAFTLMSFISPVTYRYLFLNLILDFKFEYNLIFLKCC
jgi:hypothetical protein